MTPPPSPDPTPPTFHTHPTPITPASHAAEHVPILWLDRLVGNVTGLPADVAKVYDNWKSV